jgi:hypothetical protein
LSGLSALSGLSGFCASRACFHVRPETDQDYHRKITCQSWSLKTKATPVASPQIERIWPVNRAGTVAAFRKPVRRRDRGPVFKALRALMGPPSDPNFQTALIEMSPIGVHI